MDNAFLRIYMIILQKNYAIQMYYCFLYMLNQNGECKLLTFLFYIKFILFPAIKFSWVLHNKALSTTYLLWDFSVYSNGTSFICFIRGGMVVQW